MAALQHRITFRACEHILFQTIPLGKRDGRLERILDLPAVPTLAGFGGFPVLFCEGDDFFAVELNGTFAGYVLVEAVQAVEVHFPDGEGIRFVKGRVVEGAVDA